MLVFVWRRLQDLRTKSKRAALPKTRRRSSPATIRSPACRTGATSTRSSKTPCTTSSPRIAACAVLMLDLDGFKAINDVHGHLVGDKALIEFSERVTAAAKGALVARVGGDEFAIVLPRRHLARRAGGARAAHHRVGRRAVRHRRHRNRRSASASASRSRPTTAPTRGRAGAPRRSRALPRQGRRPLLYPLLRAGDGRPCRAAQRHRARIALGDRLRTRSRSIYQPLVHWTATASSASRRWRAGRVRCSAAVLPNIVHSPSPRNAA